jgi:hypothetical protein
MHYYDIRDSGLMPRATESHILESMSQGALDSRRFGTRTAHSKLETGLSR